MQSDPSPEASEQRIRMRVAVVSALSTAGYEPKNSSRLGLATWDANNSCLTVTVTTQTAYPFEVFRVDVVRRVEPDPESGKHLNEIVVPTNCYLMRGSTTARAFL